MNHANLLAPGRIGSMTLRNRILMCPMGDNQATAGGYVTDQQIDYFEARARGGAALLLVGGWPAAGVRAAPVDHYTEGKAALDAGRYASALEHFKTALDSDNGRLLRLALR